MDAQLIKDMHDAFNKMMKVIKENDRFIIYRHSSPDFDALGAQMGLATWIKDNFPDKTVHFVGDEDHNLIPLLFPHMQQLTEADFMKEHVAITVDVADSKRVSCNHLNLAKYVLKIDHHNFPPKELDFGQLKVVFPTRPAASEILALFALSRPKKYILSKEAATYLYIGIIGDTNRFLYQDTDSATLRIAGDLLDCGVDKTEVYHRMYQTDMRRLNLLKFCLNNYKVTDAGIAYYVFDKKDLEDLCMTTNEGNLHINVFRDLENVKAVASITYDNDKKDYRVSIRSRNLVVDKVAKQFNGGGHDFAAGCRISNLSQLSGLLSKLDQLASDANN